jgi:HEAT repeat protein
MVTEESVKRMKEQRDVDGLIRALDDGDEWVRGEYCRGTLGEIGEPLISALNDSNGWVRDFAVLALGKIGDPRAIDPLSNLVNYEKLLVNMD